MVKEAYYKDYLDKGPEIVAFGGGTGLSTLLRGIKNFTSNITAIVTMTDDGGSSGRLRSEMGMLPPGDMRNCLLALAETEPLMEKLFQHRFIESKTLKGHSLGNLIIAAMTEMMGFESAIREVSKVLAVRGKVLPVTLEPVILSASFTDGTFSTGQTRIVKNHKSIKKISLLPEECQPLPDVLKAISEADIIIMGPGSLYTSVLPNLLVTGIKEAVRAAPAITFYACNIMTEPGETDGMKASEHLETLYRHGCIDLINAIVVNNHTEIPEVLLKRYQEKGASPVMADYDNLKNSNLFVISDNLLNAGELAHHDSQKLARLIIENYFQIKKLNRKI